MHTEIITRAELYGDAIRDFLISHGPILVIVLLVLLVGKLLIGRINISIAKSLKDSTRYQALRVFLERNNAETFLESWRAYFRVPGNKSFFVFSFIANVLLMIACAKVLAYNASHPGHFIPPDPLMRWLQPVDFSVPIFVLEYLSIIFLIFYMSDKPGYFIKCLWSVCVLLWLRTFMILVTRFSPSPDMIVLKDPFTQFFFGENVQVTNDLFFSGHVGLLAFFYLIVDNKYLKAFLLFTMVAVGFMLIWQQVHYTLDVLFAPLFSKLIFELVTKDRLKTWFFERYSHLIKTA
jgi:hypothetical protein